MKNATVSEDFAKKFATEKETPYTRWVHGEGLDIVSSFYVENLHTVELSPGRGAAAKVSFSTTMPRAPRTTAMSARSRRARASRRSASSTRR